MRTMRLVISTFLVIIAVLALSTPSKTQAMTTLPLGAVDTQKLLVTSTTNAPQSDAITDDGSQSINANFRVNTDLPTSADSQLMATTFQLSGHVTDQSGNPLSDVTVAVIDPASSSTVASATTASNGSY